MQAGDNINMNIVWTAASLILTRLFTVYTSAQTQKQTMQQQMSAMLYDKMQDSQEGVVSSIMEVGVVGESEKASDLGRSHEDMLFEWAYVMGSALAVHANGCPSLTSDL
jgi:uncharacterized membrane protein